MDSRPVTAKMGTGWEVIALFDYTEMRDALQRGQASKVREEAEKALAHGCAATDILTEGLVSAMAIVGEKFKRNEVYVPEVMVAARAMTAGLEVIKPILVQTGAPPAGRIVIGTVRGDLHDIGKNLVRMMYEGAGFHVVDLGVDVSPTAFVDAVRREQPDLLGMSALLTTTMPAMKSTIEALEQAGVRGQVRVMVGGAPVTARYAEEIRADGYAPDATTAVEVGRALIGA
jgi:5-methyltetrahydrofolate--homocysteine methyltransferase